MRGHTGRSRRAGGGSSTKYGSCHSARQALERILALHALHFERTPSLLLEGQAVMPSAIMTISLQFTLAAGLSDRRKSFGG